MGMLRATPDDWTDCPICGEPDMRSTRDGDEDQRLISCTNHGCASNGGPNAHAFLARLAKAAPDSPTSHVID